MTQDNVARVKDMYDRAPEDPSVLADLLDEDVEWKISALGLPGLGDTRGPAGVLDFFRRWAGAFDEWGYQPNEVFEAGEFVVAHVHQWGVGKASGARVDNHFWQVWEFHDGKVVRATHHAERADALKTAS